VGAASKHPSFAWAGIHTSRTSLAHKVRSQKFRRLRANIAMADGMCYGQVALAHSFGWFFCSRCTRHPGEVRGAAHILEPQYLEAYGGGRSAGGRVFCADCCSDFQWGSRTRLQVNYQYVNVHHARMTQPHARTPQDT
jgi:hypothetical protein